MRFSSDHVCILDISLMWLYPHSWVLLMGPDDIMILFITCKCGIATICMWLCKIGVLPNSCTLCTGWFLFIHGLAPLIASIYLELIRTDLALFLGPAPDA
jgi:hypothetical protein